MNLSVDKVRDARDRDGSPTPLPRPDEVENWDEPEERVGYQKGIALADGFEYEDYCRGDSLYKPSAAPFLEAVFDHPLVVNVEAAAEEIGTDVEHVENAADLHGIEAPDGERENDESATVSLLTAEIPDDPSLEDMAVSYLYLEGMGAGEISSHLSREGWSLSSRDVIQTLARLGLIDRQERARDGRVRDSEVTTISGSGIEQ
jgi:hypothetical protein